VDGFIGELEIVKKTYGMESIYFADDLFVWNKNWLKEFAPKYLEKIGLPFMCTCRADMIDEERIQYLKEAGCHSVTFGVETGNDKLRNEILNKNVTNEQIKYAAHLFKNAGIIFQTSNMFCLPGESVEDAIKTIDLNIEIGTTSSMSAIFMPFPKTELADQCIEMKLLKEDYTFSDLPNSFISYSILKLKDRKTIERLQKVSSLIIQYPKLRGVLIFAAKYIKWDLFHFILYLVGTVLRFREERQISLFDTFVYLWSYRKNV